MSSRRLTEARRSRSARFRFSCVNLAHDSGVEALRVGSGPAPRLVGAPANGSRSHQALPAPPYPRVLGALAQNHPQLQRRLAALHPVRPAYLLRPLPKLCAALFSAASSLSVPPAPPRAALWWAGA